MIEKITSIIGSALRHRRCTCLSVILACLLGGVAKAQGPAPALITAPLVYPGAVNTIPNAVAMGDFNGDGLLDFVVVEYNPNLPSGGQVEIFLGHPDGSFAAGNIYPIGTISGQPYDTNHNIAVGHFNGPLQPEGIAVAVTQAPGCPSGGVVLLYGPGDGTFPNTGCLANSPGVISVAVADYNNDTYDDIAVSNASGAAAGSITVYFNNGTVNAGSPPNSFYKYGSYSSVLPGNGGATAYGTLVAGNLPGPGSNGPSLAMLSNGVPFTQYVSIFENILAGPNGNPLAIVFYPSYQPLTISGNGISDIAWTNLPVQGPTSLVGIGAIGSAGGLQAIPITYPVGIGPGLGPLTPVAYNLPGIAIAVADFDGNGVPDFAYLDGNENLNIDLNPGATSALNIGPFGPKGHGVAAALSTGLNKWVVVDSGIDQPTSPLFTTYNAARSIAVYLFDPTTGQPATLAPLYAQSSLLTTGTQRAFAVADFNGVGVPDVAVLGQDEVNFDATVSIFQNAYKAATPPTPPGYATPPTVIDLGTLLGLSAGSIGYGGSPGYALAAGSFRVFDPDIAIVTSQGITLLENQGANTQAPFNFSLAPNCQGFFGAPPTPPNNCYLGGDSHYPGLSNNSPRPPIIAVDVNGDGYQDVVVAYPENCNASSHSAIYVFISNGDGTFQPPIYIPSPVVNPVGLTAGRLLGNSVPDLVVVNGGEVCSGTQAITNPQQTSVGAAVIPNNGAAGFGTAQPIFSQTSDVALPSVSAVAVADMNGDGTPDVVISATDGLHVLLNSSSIPGSFTDQGAVPLYGPVDIITNAAQIDIADLNKDGALDVAAAVGGIVYIFPGDGKGGLSTPVQAFAAGPDSNQVRAIDVNGDGTADVVVNNSLGFSVLLNGSASTGPTTLTITAPPLMAGTVGVPYGSVQFLATGGSGQLTFTVSPSMLAGGLSLTTTGLLNGTPTQAGTFPFTVSASDTNGDTGSQAFSLTIASASLPPPIITSVTPGSGPTAGGETVTITGRNFQNGAMVTFARTPATSVAVVSATSLSVVVPAIPAGSVDVQVTNPDGQSAVLTGGFLGVAPPPPPVSVMVSETITVADTPAFPDVFDAETIHVQDTVSVRAYAPLVISPLGPLLPGVVNNPYPSVTFTATGGAGGPLVLTESGSIPGLGFVTGAGSLTLSGTPTAAGPGYTFSITVTDALGDSATQNYVLGVSAACQSITVSPSGLLVAATVGSTYQQQFSQAGAVGNVTWSSSGTLPSGLTLSASGLLSGTPATANTYAFSIIATDQNGCSSGATQESLTVNLPALPPAIVSVTETIKVNDTVSFPDVFDPETIHVNDTVSVITLQSIAVTPANPTIAEGASVAFTATGTFSDGSTQNLTSTVAWSSSNTTVATMTGNHATAATGHTLGTLGTTTITATLGSTHGSTVLTVNSHLSITAKLSSITLASNGTYVVKLAVSNSGDIAASQVTPAGILGTKLDSSAVPALNLAPGATATVTLVFPATAGRPGTKQNLSVAGLATGTNPNGTPVLPALWALQPTPTQVTLP